MVSLGGHQLSRTVVYRISDATCHIALQRCHQGPPHDKSHTIQL